MELLERVLEKASIIYFTITWGTMRNQLGKQVFPKDGESKLKETIQNLKSQVKALKKQVDLLKNENKQLQKTIESDINHINDLTSSLSLEEVLEFTKAMKSSPEIRETEKEKVRKKFAEKYGGKS